MAHLIDIKDLSKEELVKEISSLGAEKFRAVQVLSWVYKKHVREFDGMVNLPAGLRDLLKGKFYISGLKQVRELASTDGTRKFLFGLEDSSMIESVFIPSKNTNTACVSSQVGCRFACKFCASGRGGFVRNLRPAEMINQVLQMGIPISNVVFMGMGEPLDNYENVLKAVRQLNAPYALGIGRRKITISTCGIVPGIKRLIKEDLQVELSISLHSPDDKVRSALMGVNNKYPLKELISACREYIKETNRQITFEYVLIKGVNDSRDTAERLAKLIKGLTAKVNLIPYNPSEGTGYLAPGPKSIKEFKQTLDRRGVISIIRVTRGADILAACGQLRAQA